MCSKTIFQKALYRYAYGYAKQCQRFYFLMYFDKYIKKHIKYRLKNDEYELLAPLIDNNTGFERVVAQLQTHKDALRTFLYDENVAIYHSKRQYSYRLYTVDDHIDRLVRTCTVRVDTDVLSDIVRFSLYSQDLFYKSDLTAKTKIQEHWFMRLPIYLTCLTVVLAIKLLELNEVIFLNLFLIFAVYLLSVFLVVIRFHQSVSADTKKIYSEMYTKAKNSLFVHLIETTRITL